MFSASRLLASSALRPVARRTSNSVVKLTPALHHRRTFADAAQQSPSTQNNANNNNNSSGSSSSVLLFGLVAGLTAAVGYGVFSNLGQKKDKKEQDQTELVTLFGKYASIRKGGVQLMTPDDFLNALAEIFSADETRPMNISPAKLKALVKIADRDKSGLISLDEFLLFEKAVSNPFADYEIAFHLFDRDSDNRISKSEFFKVMQAVDESEIHFDLDSEFVRLFWGAGDKKPMSFPAFSQMLKSLQAERLKQMFKFYDKDQTGYIKQEEFKNILESMTRHNIPSRIKDRLATIGELNMRKGHVTYAQFSAVQAILLHMPSYERILREATSNNLEAPVTKEKFLQTAFNKSTVEITPMELDILYHVFGEENAIKLDNFLVLNEKPNAIKTTPVVIHGSGFDKFLAQAKESAVNFGIGSVAGGVGATAVYPIDLVKTRMQNQRAVRIEERLYKNSFDCFWKVVSREGFFGLYKGLLPQLVGVAPEKAIKLTVNDLLRGLFEDKSKGEIYFPLEVLAGAGAGASQVVFTNPLEIVKIRLQVAGEVGARPSAINIVRQLGFVGLYKGASACFLRDIPFSAIYFPTYAKMKIVLSDENGRLSKLDLLLAGAIAGVPAASLVTPADVIKTRLQVEARKGEATYSGIADCAAKIMASEGPRAFFKGAGARVFRSSPQFGITLLSYELLQSYLAPDLPARPPTNAPVTQKDIDQMRTKQSMLRVADLENRWRLSH
eukprot:TRINITY_DN609_c0_g4_i1.p1 TRINITY_DN609_c0_g4~~TRINITY_DN609_c0_g4_i1.p1  ORF type:complete len:727 (-),score=223.16 TRINITY_DN609_c0_g4_i1:188-2368(-)